MGIQAPSGACLWVHPRHRWRCTLTHARRFIEAGKIIEIRAAPFVPPREGDLVMLDVGLARVVGVGGFRDHRDVRRFLSKRDPSSARALACASAREVWATCVRGKRAFADGRGFWAALEFYALE